MRRLREGPFYETVIDSETGQMTVLTSTLEPTGVAIVEKNSTFSLAQKNMRSLTTERTSWIWEAHVQFPSTSVSMEAVEEALMDACISIPPDGSETRSLLAALVATEYTYPPEQSPNGGTLAVFTFQILPQSLRK